MRRQRIFIKTRVLALFATVFTPILLAGCGTLPNGRGWGQDAGFAGTCNKLSRAAYNAFFDLQTLIPAAAALVFTADDFDEEVSEWAREHTPVFGSEEAARDASDYLRAALGAETFLTALATPSGEDPEDWTFWKLKGLGVEALAFGVTAGTTALFKDATNRNRPDDSNEDSLPSGHASHAFSLAALSNGNLASIAPPGKLRFSLQAGNVLLATACAWARVEGGKHFPSDVLAGAALGHFLSAFVYDAFMGLPESRRFGFFAFPLERGVMAQLSFQF